MQRPGFTGLSAKEKDRPSEIPEVRQAAIAVVGPCAIKDVSLCIDGAMQAQARDRLPVKRVGISTGGVSVFRFLVNTRFFQCVRRAGARRVHQVQGINCQLVPSPPGAL